MNITYLVVGGLTGVGYAFAMWLFENRARNVLTVSRNAISHPGVSVPKKKAKEKGCCLFVQDCDIANEKFFLELLGVII